MKRLVVGLVVLGGVAWWGWRRLTGGDSVDPWSGGDSAEPYAPPRLGGEVDPDLLAILACPVDKHPVTREGNYLVCEECQRH
jgi:hypothetical protein